MDKKDFNIGQTVYLKIISGSNVARRISNKGNHENWIVESVVSKVGNKYIEVDGRIKFDIKENFNQVYTYGGSDYKLYLTKKEILAELRSEELYLNIRREFLNYDNNNRLTLEVLEGISELLSKMV